uniref:SSD domain-containing protein n=1 Tax=Panagrellus redivivus TaxID=6233 RepID=A0A7E4VLW0_PANRE
MRPLEKFFDAYGRYIAKNPWPFIIVPTIITLISAVGLTKFQAQNNIWDIYAPLNAKSRIEEAALEPFEYASASHHYRIQILVDRKDGGNVMNKDDLAEIAAVNKVISDNITVSDGTSRGPYAYKELCGVYCNNSNALVIGFLQAIVESKGESSSFVLTYPNAQALQNQVFLGYSIGKLHWVQHDDLLVVDQFRLFILHYMVDTNLPNGNTLKTHFEMQLRALFEKISDESQNLNYAFLSRTRELEEQSQISLVSIPYLGLTGLILTFFMILTLFNYPFYKSQHIEAVFGVISPGMALITTFGSMWAIGVPFSNILTVVPFLIITIGIDDAFLILAGWRHSSGQTDFESRMGAALAKSGASVSVTSITDILCFGVGLVSQMPVVQLFCLYTCVALTIDFIYQLTIFSAIVGICGKRQVQIEEALQAEHKQLPSETSSSTSDPDTYLSKLKDLIISTGFDKSTKSIHRTSPTAQSPDAESSWLMAFVHFLHLKVVRVSILVVFIVHLVISVYLCTLVNTHFDMENLYLRESPLTPISRKMQQFMLNESFVVNFVVDDMGSFEDEVKREQFANMLTELESIPKYSMGSNGSTVWLRDYENSVGFWGEDDDTVWEPVEMLRNYRSFNLGENFITTKKLETGDEVIDSFYFVVTYHNMKNFLDVEEMLLKRRAILARYAPVFNVSSHHPFEKVPTESAASAPANFIQTAVSAIALMSVLVLLFVMDIGAIFSVVLSILSISTGTVGYLHLWGVNLDAVSLISMLMSIGFSVDYSAHICYHYFTMSTEDDDETPRKKSLKQRLMDQLKPASDSASTYHRLEHTFNGVGWPVIQSGLSTVLGMIPLLFVNAYVVAVFWKTIILVTVLGLWHALFLLPALFLAFDDITNLFRRRKVTTSSNITCVTVIGNN